MDSGDRVPWTAKRSKQSIPREINPEYSLGGLMLKLQYFGHMMQRTNSLVKPLMLGKTEGRKRGDDRGWDGWMASPTQWTWVWASSGRWWRTGRPGVLQSMGLQRVGHDWATEKQGDEFSNVPPIAVTRGLILGPVLSFWSVISGLGLSNSHLSHIPGGGNDTVVWAPYFESR